MTKKISEFNIKCCKCINGDIRKKRVICKVKSGMIATEGMAFISCDKYKKNESAKIINRKKSLED